MASEEKVKAITHLLYKVYGSGAGVLFGIPLKSRSIIETIIRFTVEYLEREPKAKTSSTD